MRTNKLIYRILACAIVSLVFLNGCGNDASSTGAIQDRSVVTDSRDKEYHPEKNAKKEAADYFEYIRNKDIQSPDALFSSDVQASHDLQKEWEAFFDALEGNIVSYENISYLGEEVRIDEHKVSYTDTTKTKKFQSSLKFPQNVINLLREYKAEQDEERITLGTKWIDYDRLFVKWNVEPMNNNTPYFWLKEFCEENNFRFCDIHSLRHFYASALINKGVDAAAVSGALGHSTITTTTSIYCHVFNQAQARASEAIASVLDFKKPNTDKGQSKTL